MARADLHVAKVRQADMPGCAYFATGSSSHRVV